MVERERDGIGLQASPSLRQEGISATVRQAWVPQTQVPIEPDETDFSPTGFPKHSRTACGKVRDCYLLFISMVARHAALISTNSCTASCLRLWIWLETILLCRDPDIFSRPLTN